MKAGPSDPAEPQTARGSSCASDAQPFRGVVESGKASGLGLLTDSIFAESLEAESLELVWDRTEVWLEVEVIEESELACCR